jgi:hypothetical protein
MRFIIFVPKLPRREMWALSWKMSSPCSRRIFWTSIASLLLKAAHQNVATELYVKLEALEAIMLLPLLQLPELQEVITEADVAFVEAILHLADFIKPRQGPATSVSTASLGLVVVVIYRMHALPPNC